MLGLEFIFYFHAKLSDISNESYALGEIYSKVPSKGDINWRISKGRKMDLEELIGSL